MPVAGEWRALSYAPGLEHGSEWAHHSLAQPRENAMERKKLREAVPAGNAMRASSDFQRKEMAMKYIEQILDAIEIEGREPEEWEAHELASAIGCILMERYFLSLNYTLKALVSPQGRGDRIHDAPERATMRELRYALACVGSMPARNR
jgi:iron-sulfur cluster repair protein YtfE (RIC family)